MQEESATAVINPHPAGKTTSSASAKGLQPPGRRQQLRAGLHETPRTPPRGAVGWEEPAELGRRQGTAEVCSTSGGSHQRGQLQTEPQSILPGGEQFISDKGCVKPARFMALHAPGLAGLLERPSH